MNLAELTRSTEAQVADALSVRKAWRVIWIVIFAVQLSEAYTSGRGRLLPCPRDFISRMASARLAASTWLEEISMVVSQVKLRRRKCDALNLRITGHYLRVFLCRYAFIPTPIYF